MTESASKNVLKTALKTGLFLAISLAILGLLWSRVGVAEVLGALSRLGPGTLIAAALITLTFPVLSALRWRAILKLMGHEIPFARCLTVIMGVWPIAAISPSKSGDLLKAACLRGSVPALKTAGSVLAERLIDVMVLSGISLVGAIAVGRYALTAPAAVLLVASAGAMLLGHGAVAAFLEKRLSGRPKAREKVEELSAALRAILSGGLPSTAWILALTIANWGATLIQAQVLLVGLGARVSPLFTATALPPAIFVGLVPVTLGGLGTRDAAFLALFGPITGPGAALGLGILYSFFGYALPALVGLPLMGAAFGSKASRGGHGDEAHLGGAGKLWK